MTDVKLNKIWKKISKKPVMYEEGFIYFNDYCECYNAYGYGNKPRLMYEIPRCTASEKTKDCLYSACSLSALPYKYKGYRPHLLALTAHNHLIRRDCESGVVLEAYYLGSHCKFKYISWCEHQETFVLQSIKKKSGIFGSDIIDAMVSSHCLLVTHSSGIINIYSLQDILDDSLLYEAHLNEFCAAIDGIVGKDGIPINVKLSSRPRILFSQKCPHHKLSFGAIPLHYIINAPASDGTFLVHTLSSENMVENGILEMDDINIEADRCFFHPDESGRIIIHGCQEIRMLKLIKQENDKFGIRQEFSIRPQEDKVEEDVKIKYTSSGRRVRPWERDHCVSYDKMELLNVDYENELDLIVASSLSPCQECNNSVHVHLYDNGTGKMIKSFDLEDNWHEGSEHAVIMDKDLLIHIVKSSLRHFCCTVYKITGCNG